MFTYMDQIPYSEGLRHCYRSCSNKHTHRGDCTERSPAHGIYGYVL